MNNIVIFLFFCLGLLSCINSNKNKNLYDSKDKSEMSISEEQPFLDSLCNINFFDFYDKKLSILLDNKIIKKYNIYHPVVSRKGCIDHIELIYDKRSLVVHFSNFDKEAYCSEQSRNIENLLNEKILFVRFPVVYPMPLTNNKQEDEMLVSALKQINFHDYSGLTVDSLMAILPKPRRSPIIMLHGKNGCLEKASISYRLTTREFGFYLYPENLEHTPPCLDLEVEHWNFNDFRKEILKEVKILGL